MQSIQEIMQDLGLEPSPGDGKITFLNYLNFIRGLPEVKQEEGERDE